MDVDIFSVCIHSLSFFLFTFSLTMYHHYVRIDFIAVLIRSEREPDSM